MVKAGAVAAFDAKASALNRLHERPDRDTFAPTVARFSRRFGQQSGELVGGDLVPFRHERGVGVQRRPRLPMAKAPGQVRRSQRALMSCVAAKCRRSCSRVFGSPARLATPRNVQVALSGRYGRAPSASSDNTNARVSSRVS